MIDLKPAANPLDIPSPKPSEIVRNWPDAMTCHKVDRLIRDDGSVAYCSAGVLLEAAGFSWGDCALVERDDLGGQVNIATYEEMGDLLFHTYGLSQENVGRLTMRHDNQGKDAAADLLESLGF